MGHGKFSENFSPSGAREPRQGFRVVVLRSPNARRDGVGDQQGEFPALEAGQAPRKDTSGDCEGPCEGTGLRGAGQEVRVVARSYPLLVRKCSIPF